ncbi:hypothetical protein BGX26_002623 [Mortierella sp. AD094]|nr:hypothetical protein BGX26_002623 [Mortierella sp. AD094]
MSRHNYIIVKSRNPSKRKQPAEESTASKGKPANYRNGTPGGAAIPASSVNAANSSRSSRVAANSPSNDMTIDGEDAEVPEETKNPDEPKARIRQMNPNQSVPIVAARMWNEMAPEQRDPWLQKADQDKLRYAEEMQAYSAR